MGCCSLLAIQQVRWVSPQDRDDLDYGASYDQPDATKIGCGFRYLTDIYSVADWIAAQHDADQNQQNWAFGDPRQVALTALIQYAHAGARSIAGLKEKRKGQGRRVYEWKNTGKAGKKVYMVVVSRPSLLSFYAQDPLRVVWVVTAAYASSCAEDSSVKRVE
jgi:hypothetical protein